MDTIRIHFKDLEPQEVRVKTGSIVTVFQCGDWCQAWVQRRLSVKFKAKLERWERVRGA